MQNQLQSKILYGVKDALVYIFLEDFADISVPLKQLTDIVLAPKGNSLNNTYRSENIMCEKAFNVETPDLADNFEDKARALETFSGRAAQTARLLAVVGGSSIHHFRNGPIDKALYNSWTGQVETLSSLLVKAGRIRMTEYNAAADDNFEDLSRQYTEAVTRIRQLCDEIIFWADFIRPSEELMRLFMSDCEDAVVRSEPQRLIDNTLHIKRLAERVLMIFNKETEVGETEEEYQNMTDVAGQNQWRVELGRSITSNSAAKMETGILNS